MENCESFRGFVYIYIYRLAANLCDAWENYYKLNLEAVINATLYLLDILKW